MLARAVLLVVVSLAAYAVKQIISSRNSPADNGESSIEQEHFEKQETEKLGFSTDVEEEEEQEEKVEVKLISGEINAPTVNKFDIGEDEFEELLPGQFDFPLPDDKLNDDDSSKADRQRASDEEMANNASELERLRNLVKELEEREVKLEGELLECYGLKEQQSDMVELQRQLKIKAAEIDMLQVTMNSLQAERKKLREEIEVGASARKELEVARKKIKELQRQIQLDANQTKGQLLLLKQQVTSLQVKEEEAYRKDSQVNKKLKAVKQLEVDMADLKRKNLEVQYEKRELMVKLDAAEAKAAALSNITETEMVAKVKEEVNELKHTNEDLQKQVEGLQVNRFSEVEELVYLRWVNACLRYELRNFQTPAGNMSARDLNKNLSPKSQEKAKQLLLEYAGSERRQGDTDLDSNFSQPSSPGSEDFDNASIDSSTSKYSSLSRKQSIMQKLKKWGRSKDDSSDYSSSATSFAGGSPTTTSMSQRQRGPLESLMLRNTGDSVAITTFGKAEKDLDGYPETRNLHRIRTRVPSTDSLKSVASSFQLMSKSVDGATYEKYSAYSDRHKLAVDREKYIKEKADKARAERFGDMSNLNPESKMKSSAALSPNLSQVKEKVHVSSGSNDLTVGGNDMAESLDVSKMKLADIEKKAPRVPRPPPGPSACNATGLSSEGPPLNPGPPPPPPPPPPGGLSRGSESNYTVHRAPEVDEFYQILMNREGKKDTSNLISSNSSSVDAKRNMIGEIVGKSSFLLAVKADVETQADFVQSLAAEVRASSFTNIEDLVAFVNWLDEELSFLVDERAVLKHFDWPESKADALREAAFVYQDLIKLEKQVTSYEDDPNIPCGKALKKMYSSLEKVEQSVYALLRTRDMVMSRYKEFRIPVNWMMDAGVVGKIKLSSVKLAKKYMKRVAKELDLMMGSEKEPNREFLLLQAIRFAFRVHQFAGGFDGESMKTFEDLRSCVQTQTSGDNKAEILAEQADDVIT